MKIILAGGTGFIGKHLVPFLLEQQHEVILLVRKQDATMPKQVVQHVWDGKNQGDWSKSIDGADAVINLSGAGIADKRWSESRKQLILSSRVESTLAIKEAIKNATQRPKVWINGSAVGYYGNVPTGVVTESTTSGKDFMGDICRLWEEATQGVETDTRVVLLRTGVVLGADGGALPKMAKPFKMFAGGPIGNGKQGFPWIHMEDELQLIHFILKNESVKGAINAAAPELLSNKQFSKVLGKVLKRPSFFPVPAFMLKLIFGEMSAVLLDGQFVKPLRAQEAGYLFKYSTAEAALKQIFGE